VEDTVRQMYERTDTQREMKGQLAARCPINTRPTRYYNANRIKHKANKLLILISPSRVTVVNSNFCETILKHYFPLHTGFLTHIINHHKSRINRVEK